MRKKIKKVVLVDILLIKSKKAKIAQQRRFDALGKGELEVIETKKPKNAGLRLLLQSPAGIQRWVPLSMVHPL